MKRQKSKRTNRAAFTLLEVLMVVAILGLLAAVVVTNLWGTGEKAKRDLAQAQVDSGLNGALDRYRMHIGHYPTEDEGGLRALIEKPDDEELEKKGAWPYTEEKNLRDPWGNELIYAYPGEYNEDRYDLSSAGPDGEEGTDDDVTNWKEE